MSRPTTKHGAAEFDASNSELPASRSAAQAPTAEGLRSSLETIRLALLGTVAPYAAELARINVLRVQRQEDDRDDYDTAGAENDAHRERAMQTPILSLADVIAGMDELHHLLAVEADVAGLEEDGEVPSQHIRYRLDFLTRGRQLMEDVQRTAGGIFATMPLAAHSGVSPAIVTAYTDWQRSMRFSAAMKRAAEADTDERATAALKAFREAAERTAWDVQDGVLHGETATMDDALLQFRLALEMDDTILSDLVIHGATSKLKEVARSQPLPELPEWEESRGRPVTDEDWRTYLTAHPDRMHEAAPADLLRLFEIEEGAEVFALWSGYARAAAGTDGDMEKAHASIRAYGVLHDAMESRDGFSGGDVLTEDERAHLATMGHLPAETVLRLEAAATAAKAPPPNPPNPLKHSGLTQDEAELVGLLRQMDATGQSIMNAHGAVLLAVSEIERAVAADGTQAKARNQAARLAGLLRGQAEELEALAKGGDAFADAVSAVRAEGAGALSLPEAPSVAMVAAGATAAGISAEQMQAAYTAMVAAAQQERAA